MAYAEPEQSTKEGSERLRRKGDEIKLIRHVVLFKISISLEETREIWF